MRHGFDEIFKRMKKAITVHDMIADEKPIMVGLSGGKDSMALLYALKQFLVISKYKYTLAAGHVCLGFPSDDVTAMENFCRSLDVPFFWEKTQIGEIIFDIRKESNPCSLCAKLRRGTLNTIAKKFGCNKVALGHTRDDLLETFFLSMFYEGRLSTFAPISYLSNTDITVIRPMIFIEGNLRFNLFPL